jgi:hypothetical protein
MLFLELAQSAGRYADETLRNVTELGVTGALLLSFSVPLVSDPPDGITELPNDDWRKLSHLHLWVLAFAYVPRGLLSMPWSI